MPENAPTILDAYGAPYRVAPAPAVAPPILDEVSAEGSESFAAEFVDELLKARDEVLEAQGHGDLKLYERLLSDDQVHPCFRQRRSTIIARETKVEPAGPTELDTMAALDLREQLQNLSWDRISYRMLGGLMFGRAHAECMFRADTRDGRPHVTLDAVRVRRAQRFRFDRQKRLVLLRGAERLVMPERKFWSVTFGAEDDDDPNGKGLGSYLYWPVWFKRNGLKFWAIFLETFAQPTPKAEVPPGTPKEKQREVMALLDQIRTGGRLVHPRGTAISFLEAVRNSGGDYSVFVDRMDRTIAKIVLLQTMTTDAASTGLGSTQGEVQERVMTMGSKTDSDFVTESFMRGPATWLTEWNYPGAKTPLIYRDFSQQADLKSAADRDNVLTSIGYRPTPDRVREIYGDGYEPVPVPASVEPMPAFAEGGPIEQGAVDRALGDEGWRRVMGPQVERIEALLRDARSLEDVRDRLGELAMSEPKELAESLAKVVFAAQLQGMLGAEEVDR